MDSFFPSELISLLNSNTRGRIELGRIDLMKNFSFFEVEEKEAQNVVKALNRANWNGRKVSVEVAGEETGEGRRGSGSAERRGGKRPFGSSSEKRGDSSRNSRSERSDRAPRADRTTKGSDKTDKKKEATSPAAKSGVTEHVVLKRQTTGNSSLKIKSLTSARKDGHAESRKRSNRQNRLQTSQKFAACFLYTSYRKAFRSKALSDKMLSYYTISAQQMQYKVRYSHWSKF